jgi:hypothetical protein
MLHQLTNADIFRLGMIADRAINKCLMSVNSGQPPLKEVPAVEALVCRGMRGVAINWRRATQLPLNRLALQTVFTHSTPQVLFTRPCGALGQCELADLLIVVDDPFASTPHDRRRAVLVQAKLDKPSGQLKLNSRNEKVQFELLSTWPAFSFRSTLYRQYSRDLKLGPSVPDWSGEYGGIDQPPTPIWTQYHLSSAAFATEPPICGAISLGRLLAEMLTGRHGYGRAADPLGRDPWSETINELLHVTFGLPLRRHNPQSRRGRRHNLAFMNFNMMNFDFNGVSDNEITMTIETAVDHEIVPPIETAVDLDWPDGGMSIVRFVMGEPSTALR